MRLPGTRIVKTAVAVFVTAFVCIWVGWPPVFAVITAIVTLEPTVTDSIKKGIVRFPASAIGSFYAVLFISFFGNSAITYTLAASLTIITCYRFKLHAGLLVATITSVAMIEVIHDNYTLAFFTRLGTTSVGLVVSTLVNMLIFPPNYQKEIKANLKEIYHEMGEALSNMQDKKKMEENTIHIRKMLDKTKPLILYEVNDKNIRPFLDKDERSEKHLLDQIKHMEIIYYHIHNILPIYIEKTAYSETDKKVIYNALNEARKHLCGEANIALKPHMTELNKLMNQFWHSDHERETFHNYLLANELILLYELISIYSLIKEKVIYEKAS